MIQMIDLNSKGLIKQRESQNLEFKETFSLGEALIEYSKTLVGMANNIGGEIIFGIKNSPHEPIGLKDGRFDSFDPRALNKILLEYFSADINWKVEVLERFSKRFGVLRVEAASTKPIVCTKNHSSKGLREGAIYFRYRGETREIRHAELVELLNAEKEKEKLLWIKHIQSIASIGPQAVEIFDTSKGVVSVGGTKVLLDTNILSQLKVIKEGSFSEKEGAPTLKIIGELSGLVNHDNVVYNDLAYPYTVTMLADKLGLANSYGASRLVEHFGMKTKTEFHAEIKTGKKSSTNKYSELALNFLRDKVRQDPSLVDKVKKKKKKD